jgi:hypothetical protein
VSLRQPWEQAVLDSEELAVVRRVLTDCARLLTLAQQKDSPAAGALLAEATHAATARKLSPGGLLYYINLAIDYLDFAPAVRSRR